VASDYPKLEILVLDDCSQGSRVSEIIRSFAHDGVRFIKGEMAPDGWLAKNWAYQQLLEASSGGHILFSGVDVRFEPATLRQAVTTLLARDKRMLSVVPRNEVALSWKEQLSVLIQPIRYAWELCLPRRFFNRPPVLSTFWLAERNLLDRNGSFAAVTHSISPESFFAKKALRRDGYSFLRSGEQLEMTSTKSASDQWETAVRTRYPQLRRRIELVFLVSAIELTMVLAPFVLLVVGIQQDLWLQSIAALLAIVLLMFTYAQVVRVTYRRFLLRGVLLGPLALLLDVYVRHESLWRYEFGEIDWKGRNVCLPVMQVVPHLPKF
jgi:hypothetical protein